VTFPETEHEGRIQVVGTRIVKILIFIIAIGMLLGSAKLVEPIAAQKAEIELTYLPSSEFIKTVSLGYSDLVADLYWLKAVQYYGGYRLNQNDIALFSHLVDMITDLDPQFLGAYKLGALVIKEDLGLHDEAVRLMEKGLRHNAGDYWLTFEMGFLHYLGGDDYREAEKYFRLAATYPGADERAARFAADAAAKGGNIETSISLWKALAEGSDNRYIKELAERYIASLEAKRNGKIEGDI
jgi:hypothetical protein